MLIRRAAARARSQVVGYLTGGPQRYTGQPMAAAHKHLGITPAEWDTFMADAALTMDALRIDAATQAELGHIFAAFRSDCIVEPGHAVPKDPKLCRRPPDGDSVYAHAGGVYPLAQFCDALVDLGVEARLVACDDVRKPGALRHAPGLKYLLTELVAEGAGGPETATVKGFDAAKLGVKADEWEKFAPLVARAAAQTWPDSEVVAKSVAALVGELKPELCHGMLVADGGADGGARKALRAAGYSVVQTTAALLESDGDKDKALALLQSGWALPAAENPLAGGGGKCPFVAGSGANAVRAAAAAPPYATGGDGNVPEPLPANEADAVKTLADKGVELSMIATMLQLDEARVERTVNPAKYGIAPAALSDADAAAVGTLAKRGIDAATIAGMMKLDLAAVEAAIGGGGGSAGSVSGGAPPPAPPKAGGCPFGFGNKKPPPAPPSVLTAATNPAQLVEDLRERFGAQALQRKGEHKVAGRVLSSEQQRALDELLLEPAELCCPITLMLLSDPVIASDGVVYERAAIRAIVQQGKLSPTTLEPLEPALVPAPRPHESVLKFVAERAAALVRFANELRGKRSSGEDGDGSRAMVMTALDRAQAYVSLLLADKKTDFAAAAKLATDFYQANLAAGARPASSDVLAIAAPRVRLKVKVRIMTGHEFELNVSPKTKVKEVSDMALARVSGADAKRAGHSAIIASLKSMLSTWSARATRYLHLNGERLAPSATLADYQVFDGALLHLILDPIDAPDGVAQRTRVARGSKSIDDDADRAYGRLDRQVKNKHGKSPLAQPATLYARCGGIFGVAGFVDVCMDAWMAEPTLNANEMVANWHEKAQRCGFKFLVTQLISYQCGGPQVYTGRDMAASHKHLSISPEEWAAFIDSLHEVCDELGLPKQETDDVAAVVASMRAGCTLAEGEEAPPNPGPPPPSRCLPTSLYARLGGCYPLALFSDRLVDALLGDSSVVITVSDERTMPALKYLFTELCCEIAGGPEVMTAPSLHTARLQLRPLDFVKMLGCVKSAADHLDDDADVAARHAAELAQALYKRSDLILSKPLPWRERVPAARDVFNRRARGARSPRSHQGGPTHQEVREAVEKIGKEWGATLLYVPTGGGAGFLLIVEQGEASRHELVRQLGQLGFGEAFGDVMTMGSVTNKDLLFCIDISGSMKTNSRIQNAANNAVRVYDNYTTPDDSVGLIWFDSKVEVKAPLGPRDKSGLRSLIDSTRDALRGATAFYDALIAACQVSANSRSRSPPPPFLFPRGDRIFTVTSSPRARSCRRPPTRTSSRSRTAPTRARGSRSPKPRSRSRSRRGRCSSSGSRSTRRRAHGASGSRPRARAACTCTRRTRARGSTTRSPPSPRSS